MASKKSEELLINIMRFDEYLVSSTKVQSRSQAQDLIKRGKVRLGTKIITKPAWKVRGNERIQLLEKDQYVSRAGQKLASVAEGLGLEFKDAVVLDVGSSTGGFTDYALRSGAKTVYAVDVGTDQLHPKLRGNPRIKLYEKTDIREFKDIYQAEVDAGEHPAWQAPDLVVADVSFISLTKILPAVSELTGRKTRYGVMAKPQFEAEGYKLHNGVVRNNKERREILARFEQWLGDNNWVVLAKRDSDVAGATGNVERFYLLARA